MLEVESPRADEELAEYFDLETRSLLLQNVTVQTGDGGLTSVDVLVSDGKVGQVGQVGQGGPSVPGGEARIIDGEGRRVTPGKVSLSGAGAGGVTLVLRHAAHNLHQIMSQQQDKLTNTNFGLAISLKDLNYLHSEEIGEAVSGGVKMLQLSLAKLNNKQILETFKRIKALGCVALVSLDRTELESELSRVGVQEVCRVELEESQARRVCTLAHQVGVSLCIENISCLPALAVIKQFTSRGSAFYAGLTDSLLAQLEDDLTYEDVLISEQSTNVKMSSTNPAKFLGIYPEKGSIEAGADADLVIWNDDMSPYMTIVNGHVVQARGQFSPHNRGEFVHPPTGRTSQGSGAKRVQRKEDVKRTEEVTNTINIDTSAVTEANQVPGIFQRRVSAYGIRNQQDSTFNLTQPDSYSEQEQCHSLTGSRRASVKVHAPPGGLSSGFW